MKREIEFEEARVRAEQDKTGRICSGKQALILDEVNDGAKGTEGKMMWVISERKYDGLGEEGINFIRIQEEL